MCAKLGNTLRAAIFFYILSPWGDNNIDVQSDLIFARSEEVYTSDHIDEFITSQKTCLRWKYILIFFFKFSYPYAVKK